MISTWYRKFDCTVLGIHFTETKTGPCFKLFGFNASFPSNTASQFALSDFRFNALCLAALYYANPLFVMGM